MTPDDLTNATRLLDLIRSAGLTVTLQTYRLGYVSLTATDGNHTYKVSGDNLYHAALELAKQLGWEDLD